MINMVIGPTGPDDEIYQKYISDLRKADQKYSSSVSEAFRRRGDEIRAAEVAYAKARGETP